PVLAGPLLGMGRTELARHAPGPARRVLERALAIREAQPGAGIELADIRFVLAQVCWSTGERERALPLARAARDGLAKAGAAAKTELGEVTKWYNERAMPVRDRP